MDISARVELQPPQYSRREVAAILFQWLTPDQYRIRPILDKSLETAKNRRSRQTLETRDTPPAYSMVRRQSLDLR